MGICFGAACLGEQRRGQEGPGKWVSLGSRLAPSIQLLCSPAGVKDISHLPPPLCPASPGDRAPSTPSALAGRCQSGQQQPISCVSCPLRAPAWKRGGRRSREGGVEGEAREYTAGSCLEYKPARRQVQGALFRASPGSYSEQGPGQQGGPHPAPLSLFLSGRRLPR